MDERITGILREITTSPLSIEILFTAIRDLSLKAGYTPDQTYEVLLEALLDWDK